MAMGLDMNMSITHVELLTRNNLKVIGLLWTLLFGFYAGSANAGIDAWSSLGPEGARVTTLAIDPSNPAVVYVGTGNGVYKSTDSGATWQFAVTLGVHILKIDPLNPATVYAGTGGFVYKSTDGGATWQTVGVEFGPHGYQALAIDPTNPAIVYAGSSSGVIKSTDSGASWQAVNTGLAPDCINTFDCNVTVLAIDRSNPTTIYAGTSVFSSGSVFKSTDGAASWQAINNGLPNANIVSLAIDPNNPDTVYAGAGFSGAFKTTDGGINWQPINGLPIDNVVLALVIDPNNPAIVYAGMRSGGIGTGVFKSTDGGATWQAVNIGLTDLDVRDLALDPGNPATVYAGTDGSGVFKITFSTELLPVTPVVLVHGWCGSPSEATWGQMLPELQAQGLNVDYARYPTNNEGHLRRLASYLRTEVRRILDDPVLNPSGTTKVDVITHSMGGLVAQAWIVGLGIDGQGQTIAYNNEIRRLVMVATPNYGSPFKAFEAGLDFICSARRGVRSTQVRQMEFGSQFLWILHQSWTNTPFAQQMKPNILTIVGTGFNPTDATDGVVPVPSAALSDPNIRARYVDRGHFNSIVKIGSESHETFRLAKSFLLADDPSSHQADDCEVPTCRRDLGPDAPGMILMRLVNARTGNRINVRRTPVVVQFEPAPPVPGDLVGCTGRLSQLIGCDLNPEASTVTITAISPGTYQTTVTVLDPRSPFPEPLFGPGVVNEDGVRIAPARTTVPSEVRLLRAGQ